MSSIRTNYENWYSSDEYYWGTEPASFCDRLIQMKPPVAKLLDIGCGEGKDAVYFAQHYYDVTAFDLTENGIEKTKRLASERKVNINTFVADINDFEINDTFDIIYSTGTVQYLFDENKRPFFEKIAKLTNKNGIVYFNVFVEKSFIPLPPDWDIEEKMWKTGELFTYFADWKIIDIKEIIFDDNSGGTPHQHCMDTIIAQKI